MLDAAGPIAAFEIAERYAPGAYALATLAPGGGAVSEFVGRHDARGDGLRRAPSTRWSSPAATARGAPIRDAELLDFLRAQMASTRRMASVCSGAFLLAAAGLLDGRRATTHWSRTQNFARELSRTCGSSPTASSYATAPVWTSAGITAGIDLALALIADDLGEDIARSTARQLVVYRRRPGGQSQFSALIEMERPEGRFGPLLGWARERLFEELGVERLAERRRAMSPRTFARRFAEETGLTPARAIERLRVETARERIEGVAGSDRVDRAGLRLRRSRAHATSVPARLWPASAGPAPHGGAARDDGRYKQRSGRVSLAQAN